MGSARSLRSTEVFEVLEILNDLACSALPDALSVRKTILHKLERFLNDMIIQRSQTYYVLLHDVAVNITNPSIRARWSLTDALVKVQDCTTLHDDPSFSRIKGEINTPNQVTKKEI